MLSDEEKKAIEHIKAWVEFEESAGANLSSFRTVLNLIEKQSKEIEHWKAGMKIVEKDKNNHIERLEKEIEEYKKQLDSDYVKNNYTSNDKIKAKIQEYDDKGMAVNLANRSAGKTFQQAVHYEVKKVLESLLEKEQMYETSK